MLFFAHAGAAEIHGVDVVEAIGFVFSVAAPLWNSHYGHHKPDLFHEYPWIHLMLASEEIKKWFIEHHKNHSEVKNINHHVEYMLNKTFFNMKKQKEYIDICENLGLKIVVNTTDKEPESVLTNEAEKILVPQLGKDELLSVTHRFIAQ